MVLIIKIYSNIIPTRGRAGNGIDNLAVPKSILKTCKIRIDEGKIHGEISSGEISLPNLSSLHV